jgi:carbon monoxide dehydrogenase subunit G
MRRVVLWSLLGLVTAACMSVVAAEPLMEVAVKRLGPNRVHVAGSTVVEAPLQDIWRVLTDYDHLSDFIPGLRMSRTLATAPKRLLVQEGIVRWWIFQRKVRLVFEVEEVPPHTIRFAAVDGDFLEHRGTWRVEPRDGQARIEYEATMRPNFVLPPVVGGWLLKGQLVDSLRAIAARVEAVSATTAATTP